MEDTTLILNNKDLNAITKVWRIARVLHEAKKLNVDLYYAILLLKDEKLSEIQFDESEQDNPYFDDFR